jgi:chromate reductase
MQALDRFRVGAHGRIMLQNAARRGPMADTPANVPYVPTASEPPLRVAAFAGSLRRASYNRALLRACVELAPAGLAIEIASIDDVPLYDEDVERAGEPPGVARLRAAVRAADGVLIATPEYNHGVPGVTKNAVDWLSRPPRASALGGKPVAILGASPGMTGTARGQSQLRQAFEFTDSYCLAQPEVLVARAHEKFDAEGRLTDEKTREHLGRFLAAFAAWIRRFRAPSSD